MNIYDQKEELVGSEANSLLSFDMIIVTACASSSFASLTVNPNPFVWPLEDYTWAAMSDLARNTSPEDEKAWRSSHPGFS